MLHRRVRRAVSAVSVALSFVFLFAIVALAQDRAQDRGKDPRQNAPGQFDSYVLALSWSPSYCEAARARASARKGDMQCGGRPFAFVVHGLWPQYEQGFPSYCQVPAPKLDRAIVGGALELMPSPNLVMHEWDRHGTCTGLTPAAYFETVRKARAVVKIPADYLDLAAPISVTPDEVAEAFVKINPGLSRADMAVACDKTRLTEVRLCVTKDFSFHACPDVARRSCARDKVAMPAVRSEHAAATP
jgi:ribonuclease T2